METFKPPFTAWEVVTGVISGMLQVAVTLWPVLVLGLAYGIARIWWRYEHPRISEATLRAVGRRKTRRWR